MRQQHASTARQQQSQSRRCSDRSRDFVFKVLSFFNTCCRCYVSCLYRLLWSLSCGNCSLSVLFEIKGTLHPALLSPTAHSSTCCCVCVYAGLHNCGHNCTRRTTSRIIHKLRVQFNITGKASAQSLIVLCQKLMLPCAVRVHS